MNNSFIVNQVEIIQKEYLYVLKKAKEQINTSDFNLLLDEITIFWYSKREIIRLIINYISKDNDCFLFTGASFLDVDDNEHLPFVLLGDIRIIDDPITKYNTLSSDDTNVQFHEIISNEIWNTISDNIKVIETTQSKFIILPITQVADIDNDFIKQGTEKVFWSLFLDEKMNFEKYIKNIDTIEQVKTALRVDVIDRIIFSSNENESSSFEERFREYLMEVSPLDEKISDSKSFYFIMVGFISQALNTIHKCLEYNMTPYLRYDVSFKYSMLIGSLFTENKEIRTMLNKAAIAHLVYQSFRKGCMTNIKFDEFIDHIREKRIVEDLKEIITKKNSEENKYLLKDIWTDINKIIEKTYLVVE